MLNLCEESKYYLTKSEQDPLERSYQLNEYLSVRFTAK